MPTTRRRRARGWAVVPLDSALIDFLLTGRTRDVPPADDPEYDCFLEFVLDRRPAEIAALWREHEAALMAEWRRRGGDGAPWGARFAGLGRG